MSMVRLVSVLITVAALGIAACTDEPPPAESERATIFESQTRALERAKGVEQVIQQGAAEQRRAIDEAAR